MSIEQTIRTMLDKHSTDKLVEQVGADKVGDGPKIAPGQPSAEGVDEPNVKRNNTVQSVISKGQGVSGKGSADGKRSTAAKPAEKRDPTNYSAPGQTKEELDTSAEEVIYDASEDVAALMNGEDLSEEFKAKATTIFEAAVVTRVRAEIAKLEETFEARLQEQFEEAAEGLVEQVDGYLDLMVKAWMKDNALALESGLKTEITENFMNGLQSLFKDNYIEVPEEKFDILSALEEEVADLSAKLDEAVATNVDLNRTVTEMQRDELVAEAASGLSDIEAEKFSKLAEELAFEGTEAFQSKLQTIRESYFAKAKSGAKVLTESVVTDAPVDMGADTPVVSGRMGAYAQALDKLNK